MPKTFLIISVAAAFLFFTATCTKNPVGSQPASRTVTTMADIDGNIYTTIKIGSREWMAENLRTTTYNDGSAILLITNDQQWPYLTIPAYCCYNDTTDSGSIKKFGVLYNWYAVNPANPKKIAPAGWHVPTDADWSELENYLTANGYCFDETATENTIAKSLSAQTDWLTSSIAGTIGCNLTLNNRSGFSALPGGYRNEYGFYGRGTSGGWWSATEGATQGNTRLARYRSLFHESNHFASFSDYKKCGFAVRLVRD